LIVTSLLSSPTLGAEAKKALMVEKVGSRLRDFSASLIAGVPNTARAPVVQLFPPAGQLG
jgi:hypothetical protein